MATEPSRLEANRLYWQTDAPVGQIADALGISRRALYEILDRLPADAPCPICGGPLLFANRLARSTGDARCGTCDAGARIAGRTPAPPPQATAADGAWPGDEDLGEGDMFVLPPFPAPPGASLREERAFVLAGAALAGVLIGIGTTLLLRSRR